MKLALTLLLLLAGCGATQQSTNSECSEKELARLTTLHTAALVEACAQYDRLDDCPESLQGPINEKFEIKYAEWRDCR